MKIKALFLSVISAAGTAEGAYIEINSIGPGGMSSGWYDSLGNPTLSNVYFFAGSSPTTFSAASALIQGGTALVSQTEGGLSALGNLVNGGYNVLNLDGSLNTIPLFVVFSDGSGSQLAAYQLDDVIDSADVPEPDFFREDLFQIENVTLGDAVVGPVDHSAPLLAGGELPDGFGFNVFAVGESLATPEPSGLLLVALGGLSLALRRSRAGGSDRC